MQEALKIFGIATPKLQHAPKFLSEVSYVLEISTFVCEDATGDSRECRI
jgi:hypothetical protein